MRPKFVVTYLDYTGVYYEGEAPENCIKFFSTREKAALFIKEYHQNNGYYGMRGEKIIEIPNDV